MKVLFLASAFATPTKTATPTGTPSSNPSRSTTPTRTPTPIATVTSTAAPTPTSTQTPLPSPTPTLTPSPTATPVFIQACARNGENFGQILITEAQLLSMPVGSYQLGACKSDCQGVLNGSATFDLFGVCAGDNSSCPGCDGIPGSGTIVDQCDVCGGDNSTSADCMGIPNGAAQLDCCGSCNRDGSTCLDKCQFFDLTKILSILIGDKIKLCDTEYCAKSSNANAVTSLRNNTKILYKLSKDSPVGSMKFCGKKPKRSKSDAKMSEKTYRKSVITLGNVPEDQCLN